MNDNEFEAPSLFWVVLPVIGGIATGVGLILGLEWFGNRLPSKLHNNSESALVEICDKPQSAAALEWLPVDALLTG